MNDDERDADAIRRQCAFFGPYNQVNGGFARHGGRTADSCGLCGQFFMLASCAWYLMLTLDLLVALVNPWMGYTCKAWAYHSMYGSFSILPARLTHR
jgi:hypothetical protein